MKKHSISRFTVKAKTTGVSKATVIANDSFRSLNRDTILFLILVALAAITTYVLNS